MKIEEVKEYFKSEVYQAHSEYEVEIIPLENEKQIYLIVHLGNGYCYCFLLIPCFSKNDYDNLKPSPDMLNDFMQSKLFSNCVLKKVCMVYQPEDGKFIHKTFAAENI